METGERVEVRSLKHDGKLHRSWKARVARRDGPLFVLDAFFESEVRHDILGTIEAGTLSEEFFWADRWYSIFRFSEPTGALRCFYCNVNTPPEIVGGTLSFVDLDVDVLVRPDFTFDVLDEDEFEAHAELYGYPSDYRSRVREATEEIIGLVETRQFPFSYAA